MSATYVDDLMEGPEEEYYENGQLQVRRVYSVGRVVDSMVIAMNEDGSLAESEEWHDGRCRCYNKDRKLSREFELLNALREGVYRTYFENGNLNEELMFVEGQLNGRCRWFYMNGDLCCEKLYRDGKLDGLAKFYFLDRVLYLEIPYEKGKREGISKRYNNYGFVEAEKLYIDDQYCGGIENRYEAGILRTRCEMNYELPEGEELAFHDNGAVSLKVRYKCGMPVDGRYESLDENGKPDGHCEYKSGMWRQYDSDGKLCSEWRCYRNYWNGHCHVIIPEKGTYDGYMMDDEPCGSLEEFLDLTFDLLAAKCTRRFGATHSKIDFREFFANAYEKAMNSQAALVEYDDYAELDACFTADLPDDKYLDYLVREFVLRLRLPNDGDTEKEIVHDLKEMVGM
jgi:antitoxin component YwqK of YwqJK toxin-antitoxin module